MIGFGRDTTASPLPARRPFDSLEQEAFLNLWRTYDRLRIEEDRLFDDFDLTPQQYNALRLLRGVHPRRMRTLDLAARLVSRAPDITRLLRHLEDRGWVVRRRCDANRRVVLVGLTPKGIELLGRLDNSVRACHVRQLGHMDKDRLALLVDLLRAARMPHEDPRGFWAR